ncbi:MAG TPA: hypothetical protein DC064_12290, partial [Cyanobacteria bacterium UBA9273]|nr:hypothetical protein [Cyanobacteria bacterium UBA9273]
MPLLAQDCQEAQKVLSKIIAKTWLDEKFNSQFLCKTNEVLAENGLTLPTGVEFRVHENSLVGTLTSTTASADSKVVYDISLPAKPTALTDRHLQSRIERDRSKSPVGLCVPESPAGLCAPNSPASLCAPNSPAGLCVPESPVGLCVPESPVSLCAPESPASLCAP